MDDNKELYAENTSYSIAEKLRRENIRERITELKA
jgi:hypothetical protein